jgi:hypothetical protein
MPDNMVLGYANSGFTGLIVSFEPNPEAARQPPGRAEGIAASQKLLVAAFRATLEEVIEADVQQPTHLLLQLETQVSPVAME